MNNNLPPKQINRIATPIKLDQNGNRIEQIKPVTIEKQGKSAKKESKISFIIVIVLIIIAILSAIIFYLIIPGHKKKTTQITYNDATTTTTKEVVTYNFYEIYLNNTGFVNTAGNYVINNDFTITLNENLNGFDILINNIRVTSSHSLLSKIGFVDDLILFNTQDNGERTSKLFAVDKSGNIVYELYNIIGVDGLVIEPNNSSIIYNNIAITIKTSRVNKNIIYVDSSFGYTDGINLCDEEELYKNSVSLASPIIANYSIKYLGNHQFDTPKNIYTLTVDEYLKQNSVCN